MENETNIYRAVNKVNDYWTDGELYTIWKYLNSDRLINTSAFYFYDIVPAGGKSNFAMREFIKLLKSLDEESIETRFNEGIYSRFDPENYKKTLEFIERRKELPTAKVIKKMLSNKCDLDDIKYDLDDILRACGLRSSSITNWVKFSKKIPDKTKEKLNKYIESHIEYFIKNELLIEKKNYYKFEKQKNITFLGLSEYIEKYGSHFKIEYGKHATEFTLWDAGYLFIHSLVALEHLKYLTINEMWVYDWEDPSGKERESYKAKITIKENFINENKNILPDKESRNNLEPEKINYDDNTAIIKVGDKKCQIPPYKNEHFFCRAMYEHGINEPIDWSIVYEKMTGYYEDWFGKPLNKRENWRIVYDATEALNNRIKDCINTDDDLFTWQEKTIKRNY